MEDKVIDDTVPAIDYRSPDWQRIVEHLQAELQEHTNIVIAHDTNERKSDFHRGRIHQIRAILDWSPLLSR